MADTPDEAPPPEPVIDKDQMICCFCKTEYMPTHNTKEEAFASDDFDSREQWLSGCCGPACWDIHMKPPSSQGTTESS